MKAVATETNVYLACDLLEREKPGKWNRDDVVAIVGGGSMSTISPLIASWKRYQKIREEDSKLPTELAAAMLNAAEEVFGRAQSEYVAALKQQADELDELAEQHNEEITELHKTIDATKKALDASNNLIQSLEERLHIQVQKLKDHNERIELAQTSLKESEAREHQLAQELNEEREEHNATKTRNSELKERMATLLTESKSNSSDFANRLDAVHSESKTEMSQLRIELENRYDEREKNLRAELHEANGAIRKLSTQLLDCERSYSTLLRDKDGQLSEMQRAIDLHELNEKNQRKEIESHLSQIAKLNEARDKKKKN